ncbi:T9SS type A sorting domain-containing protein [Algibacter sp. AS12]|uniref:T9SS type A sorting domain-containing protein n=1 Tax=Algibacter sp. AS12 TaxID=3135773 RepID=UPI00398B7EB1
MKKQITYSLIVIALISFKSFSQTSSNDDCSGAINLTFGTQVSSSTDFATNSGVSSSCDSNHQDVWYKFVAPASGNIYLYLEGGGIQNYTIYDDCLGTNEIDCGGSGENYISALQSGALYYISINKIPLACKGKGDCDLNFTLAIYQNVLSQNEFIVDAFNYYPNPVKDELNLKAKHPIAKIEIFNTLGNIVWIISNVNALKTNINVSNLPSGVYFINVYSNQKIKTIKIVKSSN